jgi:hypothetical protein
MTTLRFPRAAILAGAASTSSISRLGSPPKLKANVTFALPAESVVMLGANRPKNCVAKSNSWPAVPPMDAVMASAVAAANDFSPSVGHKST